MSKILFPKTLIIGLGLIGGSFARALRQHELSSEIYAFDLDLEAIDFAKSEGVINEGANNFAVLEQNFDLVVIAAPLSAYEEIFAEISENILPKTIVIDLGSLKNFITEILPQNLQKNFIGCHPIAGSEKNGFEHSDAKLFSGKKFVICPSEKNNPEALKNIEDLAKILGCDVEFIDSKTHDEIYALVSHMPQFLSFLTREFSPKNISNSFFKTAFRLDDSDPEIWSDIFELNDENLEKFYLEFFANLEQEIELIKNNKFEALLARSKNESPQTESLNDLMVTSQFFSENFTAIFTRAIIVKSYLNLPKVKDFQSYAGNGFKDFASIISILSYDQKILRDLIQKNHKKILKILNSFS